MIPRALSLLFLFLCTAACPATAQDAASLVLVQRGTVPIILTAPHGGREPVPGISPRNMEGKPRGSGIFQYNAGGDPGTDALALGIAAEVKALTGESPYLIVARFDRKYIDANRPPAVAYDNPASKPAYDLYHTSLRAFIDEIRKTAGRGLLIDVHGQGLMPDKLIRGTHNGKAVKALIARHGAKAIVGPKGLFGLLETQGFAVYPANSVPPAGTSENGGFNGGYTVFHYGSHTPNGIDAVQFEFGRDYRQKAAIEASAKKAAAAIVGFYQAYLKRTAAATARR